MKKILLLLLPVLLPGLSFAAGQPNVILIVTDDQSWDTLGFAGGKVHTPRLDRMAGNGMWLTDFNVTSTVCSPSRHSFLTGRYAGRCTGRRFMREHPPGDQTQVENIGELGHSRCVKTKEWKYIAVRYPKQLQKKIDAGKKFRGFKGRRLERPYLTRNGHLGHYASKANPYYFEPDQLYDLKNDPEEEHNVFAKKPEVAARMQKELSRMLRMFKGRPFGEFTEGP